MNVGRENDTEKQGLNGDSGGRERHCQPGALAGFIKSPGSESELCPCSSVCPPCAPP